MTVSTQGAIDCDVHIVVPDNKVLLPYLDDYWREQVTSRGIEALDLATYPAKNPLTGRADWRPSGGGKAGTSLDLLRSQALDAFGARFAIGNVVYGGQAVFNVDFGAAICGAVNQWVAKEWLDREPRLRASIVVPMQDAELAVAEIERCAGDPRFVQVLMLATGDVPLGRRQHWPIYRAAEKHGLPVAIHAGAAHRFAPSYVGWPSFYIEDYAVQSQAIQGQLLSLIYEGVFDKFPKLRVVLLESGVAWLPSFLWRADNTWRALRMEVPWVTRAPSEIVREHVRLTAQPFDGPSEAEDMKALLDQFPADELLLFASDYPHWQFDGADVLPAHMPEDIARRMMVDNPLQTYPRLLETVQ
jgi:predicted TIM-barrel fold metal-dependent hydrolase